MLNFLRRTWSYIRLVAVTLAPSRFAILVLAIVTVALVRNGQGQEALRVVGEFGLVEQVGGREPYLVRLVSFLFADLVLALALWYFSRQILTIKNRQSRVAAVAEWGPRAMGTLGMLVPATALWLAAADYRSTAGVGQKPAPQHVLRGLAILLLVCAAVFVWLTYRRRRLLGIPLSAKDDPYESVGQLPFVARGILWSACITTAGAFVWAIVNPVGMTAWLPAPAVLLLCAAIWVFVGTSFVYLGRQSRLPVLSLLVLIAILSSRWNDTHKIKPGPSGGKRPTIEADADEWLAALAHAYPGEKEPPVFVVAAEGGGIRAAYWTAMVLSSLQTRYPTFAAHCFAIASVSGGSLGAAVFQSLATGAATRSSAAAERCPQIGDPGSPQRRNDLQCEARTVLSHDFLAPTLARMFGTDLPQQFFPIPVLPDRGRGLERAWEDAWQEISPGAFTKPFRSLRQAYLPRLFFLGTTVETGQRLITSPVEPGRKFKNALDGEEILGGDVPVSTAVHMSARFTYISPAGTICDKTRQRKLRVVDGGYFENSGAATAAEIVSLLKERNRGKARMHAIMIRYEGEKPSSHEWLTEILAPPLAMFATRHGRGEYAIQEFRNSVGPENVIEFTLNESARVPLPLGWLVSAQARHAIEDALSSNSNEASRDAVGTFLTPPTFAVKLIPEAIKIVREPAAGALQRLGIFSA